ncbi:unnamed protein product [Trypanosoma congolense IL3000]|uniref:WGS project CAEQ00000000 data, annotated contig 1645 n=1 Tax=Trypanosoma congolense (strain IL3000) TaxID=1068625 RepID=F9W7R6_TRYCI|nr:unnamed protein product [Trypanosoma congolense IL3000]
MGAVGRKRPNEPIVCRMEVLYSRMSFQEGEGVIFHWLTNTTYILALNPDDRKLHSIVLQETQLGRLVPLRARVYCSGHISTSKDECVLRSSICMHLSAVMPGGGGKATFMPLTQQIPFVTRQAAARCAFYQSLRRIKCLFPLLLKISLTSGPLCGDGS